MEKRRLGWEVKYGQRNDAWLVLLAANCNPEVAEDKEIFMQPAASLHEVPFHSPYLATATYYDLFHAFMTAEE